MSLGGSGALRERYDRGRYLLMLGLTRQQRTRKLTEVVSAEGSLDATSRGGSQSSNVAPR